AAPTSHREHGAGGGGRRAGPAAGEVGPAFHPGRCARRVGTLHTRVGRSGPESARSRIHAERSPAEWDSGGSAASLAQLAAQPGGIAKGWRTLVRRRTGAESSARRPNGRRSRAGGG